MMEGQEAANTLGRIHKTLDNLDQMATNQSGQQSVSSITVDAGGVGVWIASTACMVMLGVLIVGGLWMSRELNRIDVTMSERKEEADRMQTYLSAIYAQAPHLKPKDEEKKDAE